MVNVNESVNFDASTPEEYLNDVLSKASVRELNDILREEWKPSIPRSCLPSWKVLVVPIILFLIR